MLAHTPIWPVPGGQTDLGIAFAGHLTAHRRNPDLALGVPEFEWLDALRDRATRTGDTRLTALTNAMLGLLANPLAHSGFKADFMTAYEDARRYAYPLTRALIDERHRLSGLSQDYTLACIDLGQVRIIEDEAETDPSLKEFVRDMRAKLAATKLARHETLRQVFDVYGEALVCRLLRARLGGRLRIAKIPESAVPGPDFACELDVVRQGRTVTLQFYLEVKSLDIVAAPQRLPEMMDDALDVRIELEKQVNAGERIAMAEGVVAPYRPVGDAPGYDDRSIRLPVEAILQKAAGNFKNAQFRRGPTFALANLLRLPLPGQGVGTLTKAYDDPMFGNGISGVLWHVAFGQVGQRITRAAEFEGAGQDDGSLARAGLLVDQAVALDTPGLIVLHHDDGYRFDGFLDTAWTNGSWGPQDTEEVVRSLCGDYNDEADSRAANYNTFRRR
ncbi:hypothetical protein QO001_001442 [Methylobacterium brachiatum]|uniref:Uncharacterized protein n=1 Tax=Methylobacterium brachiatum TaxID=269660 RepID=A0AAJ1TP90_9HYPH|nr:hypothetical protein [Methylobacterium brachiatum]MCB4802181.1 hypothetical protein [Methylobacterium brachiatum]MDQ0542524.1 hypothetical protein [Methylobacterium brachiatum]